MHIQGICYSDRSSTVQQNDSDRIQTTKEQYTNRQCTKWQKHNIQYRQLCVRSDVQILRRKKYVWCINNCIIVLCVPRLMSSVHEMYCLGKETYVCVWPFWCSELCSVDQMVIVQRWSVLDEKRPEWFFQPFCSLWISSSRECGGLYQWFALQFGLPSGFVRVLEILENAFILT